jgi:hypothetical protein
MGKRYLDIKEKSLESSVFNVLHGIQEASGVKKEKLDPVGKEDGDIDNDGDKDASDKYLAKRRKTIKKAMKKEELDLDEGKMSDLHQMIKDKKTPEQIAKMMKLDLKTIKALMSSYEKMVPESYEIGTEKYLKHTVNVTPGQKAWTETVTKKAASMRETLAKMWKVDEGKNVFEKNTKKDLTKEVKGGITMTGKKVADIDTNPIIKEKKK